MKTMLAAIVLAMLAPVAAQALECPNGSYGMIDQWGKARCHKFVSEPRSSQPGPGGCAFGKYPAYSASGKTVCRSFEGPSAGVVQAPKTCRAGTYPWVNASGKRVCKAY